MKKILMITLLLGIQTALPVCDQLAKEIKNIDNVMSCYNDTTKTLDLNRGIPPIDFIDPIVFGQINKKWPDLQVLILGKANLAELPSTIGLLENLTKLVILEWRNLATLPSTISYLKNLKILRISCPKMRLVPFNLPKEVWQLSQLKRLLTLGLAQKELPAEIANLQELDTLLLENSEISSLPDSITRLKNLKELNVAGTPLVKSKTWPEKRLELKSAIGGLFIVDGIV
jgi:Leucine-rich repeat (LRR) protein